MTATTDTGYVCLPEHRHGQSGTCYRTHGCRCFACRVNHTRYQEHRTKQIAYGRWDTGLVDADPIREHLRYLSEYGIGTKRVAELAGVSRTVLLALLNGRQRPDADVREPQHRVARATADVVLAVRPDIASLADGALLPSRGAQRRIQALVALGWSISRVAAEFGWTAPNLHKVLERDHVEARTHRKLDRLYEQLSAQKPPRENRWDVAAYTRSLRTAAARGWVPPLAWDDIDQDPHPPVPDETEVLDEHAVDNVLAGVVTELTNPEREEAVRRFTEAGVSGAEIAHRLSITGRTVTRIRSRLGVEGAT